MAYDAEHASHLLRDPLTITEPRERLEYLRDYLGGMKPERFNLSLWFGNEEVNPDSWGWNPADWDGRTNATALEGSCNTTACIAGHALAVFAPNDPLPGSPGAVAGRLLGLDAYQAGELFEPFLPNGPCRSQVPLAAAVRAIDHLLSTGEVDWYRALAEPAVAAP